MGQVGDLLMVTGSSMPSLTTELSMALVARHLLYDWHMCWRESERTDHCVDGGPNTPSVLYCRRDLVWGSIPL
jgi:hypothetical protein